jgi:peptide/nickel transport system substrate-binding protein
MRKLSIVLVIMVLASMILGACATPTTVATDATINQPIEEAIATQPVATKEPTKTTATEVPNEQPTEVVFEEQLYGEDLPTAPTINTPLVVAYETFTQKFSPFFADSTVDNEVVALTQIQLLTTDRTGGIIYNAIEGETVNYNGTDYLYKGPADISVDYDEATNTTVYTARLRVGMKFSDGKPVTADDVIFTYYTFLDPSYVGSTTLSSFDIIGLKDYQTQTTSEVYGKYADLADAIFSAGPDHAWASSDTWTANQQDDFWARLKDEWMADVQGIVNYVNAQYASAYAEEYIGKTPDEVAASEGLQIALGMALWGYGAVEDGILTVPSGATYNLVDQFPTIEDYYNETYAAYEGDPVEYASVESANDADVLGNTYSAFIGFWGPQDAEMGGKGVPNIAGIKKLDDYTVQVTTNGYSAPAVYQIFGIQVAPLHYYGDPALYDYENNQFGFPFGDLSKQESLMPTPMGAGPYKFIRYDNRIVYFEANEYFYRGCPKIAEVQFKETISAEVVSAIQTGTADAGFMDSSRSRFEEVTSYNSNGELTGNIITTSKVSNLGYGYIGVNADTVNVGGEPGSQASKNLRRGLATILAAYRDVAINSYYGEAASVINYPMSNTSWAAPQPTDEDYQIAFSVDVDGAPIYMNDMTPEEKYAAAEQAALGFFEAAGFTITNGKLSAAPEGAKLSYEVIVPGDGTGDHPAFAVMTGAQASLAKIGMELKINDPADSNILWDALDAGTQELWTAAWTVTIDPDMYQVYHSSGIVGEGGSNSNHYYIRDAELDKLIVDARQSDDQNYRKAIYKQVLDIIIDWAVEIPTYQRQNCIIFSTERINIPTITPDITTFWNWQKDIELLEMNT